MEQEGRARAPGAGTILNALATMTGSAFAIDGIETTATVTLTGGSTISGHIDGHPDADTALIERCVELAFEEYGNGESTGAEVRTESTIPLAAGLKSSSAAANATILATLEALGHEHPDRLQAARLGVRAARDVGVTVTGAFDDATASMLGGVTITDNRSDRLLGHEQVEWDVVVWTPPSRAFSAEADVEACQRVSDIAAIVAELAMQGRYGEAMSINGLAFCAALEFPTEPLLSVLPEADGVSLSGTGPSYVAIGDRGTLHAVVAEWETKDGKTWETTTNTTGTTTI